jgi:hypothetical protein
LGEQGIVALLPLPDSRVSLVWSAPDKLAETILQEPPEQLCQRLAQLPGQTLGAFTMLPPTTPAAATCGPATVMAAVPVMAGTMPTEPAAATRGNWSATGTEGGIDHHDRLALARRAAVIFRENPRLLCRVQRVDAGPASTKTLPRSYNGCCKR